MNAGHKTNPDYRWCEQREQYVALSVCERLADTRRKCRKCLAEFQQLPLPFGEGFDPPSGQAGR